MKNCRCVLCSYPLNDFCECSSGYYFLDSIKPILHTALCKNCLSKYYVFEYQEEIFILKAALTTENFKFTFFSKKQPFVYYNKNLMLNELIKKALLSCLETGNEYYFSITEVEKAFLKFIKLKSFI